MRCTFCDNPAIKQRVIAENTLAFSFLTNIPIVPGHILIVPRRCISKYGDLSTDERVSIEKLRDEVTRALSLAFGTTGFNFAWNEGETAGQGVPHFHLHIVPRKEGDSGITEYEPRKFLYRPGSRAISPDTELDDVTEIIKKHIKQ